jgi:hypothetical protein
MEEASGFSIIFSIWQNDKCKIKRNIFFKKKKKKEKIPIFQLGKCEQVLLYFKFIQMQEKDHRSYPFLQSKSNPKMGRHYGAQRGRKEENLTYSLIYEKTYIRKRKKVNLRKKKNV